ncbi:hypothetical protein DRQ53_10190 [bacterium]|nr:MAG: hypothetical protein DRQ53_10190 [bacterium]
MICGLEFWEKMPPPMTTTSLVELITLFFVIKLLEMTGLDSMHFIPPPKSSAFPLVMVKPSRVVDEEDWIAIVVAFCPPSMTVICWDGFLSEKSAA